jgi:7,8-dihydropterin-6-yl-methyl-4-(beta-D-ribofuranosyl)aminobenzene 5'-phosphate synthase
LPSRDSPWSNTMRRWFVALSVIFLTVQVAPTLAHSQADVVTLTIIYDNYAYEGHHETDWGFAALIEAGDQTILFDTGTRGDMLLRNFRALGKDPEEIDALVFSHDHGDHTGGMGALFETGIRPPTYILGAFNDEVRNAITEVTTAIETQAGDEVLAGIFTTGQVGEAIPEQALVIPTADGLVVLTGCAHAGVVAMLERVRELSSEPIHLVMGGFHLSAAGAGHVAGTIETVRAVGVEMVGATHCTGDAAIAAFADEFGDDFVRLGVGRVLTFPAAR